MAAPANAKNVNKQIIYEYIKELAKDVSSPEIKITATELAKRFNITTTTAYYHLNNLLESGQLVLLSKRGPHGAKFYLIPELVETLAKKNDRKNIDKSEQQDSKKSEPKIFDVKEIEKFKKELEKTLKLNKTKKKEAAHVEDQDKDEKKLNNETEAQQIMTEQTDIQQQVKDTDEETVIQKQPSESLPDFPESKKLYESLPQNELTLDERIERFLKESQNIATAEQLLTREDREVLSVMNETIQQNIIYLKDLSEQLSTVQNKDLIQELIDERNRLLKEIETLREENKLLEKQLEENKEKFSLDPNRLRAMQQNLIYTIDTWLDQPNHALALSRRQFRENLVNHINDVFRYVLGLDD
jgi:HTH domain